MAKYIAKVRIKLAANKAAANKVAANKKMYYRCNYPINLKFTAIADLT